MRSTERISGGDDDIRIPVDISPLDLYQALLPTPGSDPGLGYVLIMDTGSKEPVDALITRAKADIAIRTDANEKRAVVFSCYIEAQDLITDLTGSDVKALEGIANFLRHLGLYIPKDQFGNSVQSAGAGEYAINVYDPENREQLLPYIVKVSDQNHIIIDCQFFPWSGLEPERLHELLVNFAYICSRVIQGYYEVKHVKDLPHDAFAFYIKQDNEKDEESD